MERSTARNPRTVATLGAKKEGTTARYFAIAGDIGSVSELLVASSCVLHLARIWQRFNELLVWAWSIQIRRKNSWLPTFMSGRRSVGLVPFARGGLERFRLLLAESLDSSAHEPASSPSL